MPDATPRSLKRVLYYSARPELATEFSRAMAEVAECRSRRGAAGPVVCCGPVGFEFVVEHSTASALRALHRQFFNLVLLDLREPVRPSRRRRPSADFENGLRLLDAMDREPDIERRYGFHKILALVSGDEAPEVDARIATLGARGVGRVLRDMAACHLNPACHHLPPRHAFARHVLDLMVQMAQHRAGGKTALCLSGGGLTGLYFELGALKCFEDCCAPGALRELDLYFGISAGAVAAGMLANGYGVTEFMGGIAGHRGGRIPPLDLNLLDASHLDVHGITAPLRQLLTIAGNGLVGLLRGRLPFSLESLVFEYGDLVHAPFNTDGFESLLRQAFRAPGCSNDFRRLGRRLYIGATDQDLKEHVLFGDPPHDRVPISRAIQASMALNPVFAPTRIRGRYYADGAVTRTSNFVEAIHRGADLILALDPLVPWVPGRAGSSRERGIFYNADQDIRTVSYTRFETTRNWVLRRHPEVSLYTFLPANNVRRILSVNPMDHRPFLRIWKGAYLGTLKRIHALGYRMSGDLGFHGIGFDTARADAVAERLRAVHEPRFEDFFPDGRVELDRRDQAKRAQTKPAQRRPGPARRPRARLRVVAA
jgi:predicted acylesterase/phospholipase RssA